MACKALSVYYLVLHRKSLSTPNLDNRWLSLSPHFPTQSFLQMLTLIVTAFKKQSSYKINLTSEFRVINLTFSSFSPSLL